jgi:hypothetical protein
VCPIKPTEKAKIPGQKATENGGKNKIKWIGKGSQT